MSRTPFVIIHQLSPPKKYTYMTMPTDRVLGPRLPRNLTNSSADNGKRHRETWKATLCKSIPGRARYTLIT